MLSSYIDDCDAFGTRHRQIYTIGKQPVSRFIAQTNFYYTCMSDNNSTHI